MCVNCSLHRLNDLKIVIKSNYVTIYNQNARHSLITSEFAQTQNPRPRPQLPLRLVPHPSLDSDVVFPTARLVWGGNLQGSWAVKCPCSHVLSDKVGKYIMYVYTI